MKKRILTLSLALVLLLSILAVPTAVGANGAPKVLMGFCLDSSGSVGSSNWGLIRTGLYNAFDDPNIVPRDGSVEVCIVRFATSVTEILAPTVVDGTTIDGILATISGMGYTGGSTAMGPAVNQTLASMQSSSNYNNPNVWKVINLATDGEPNQGTPSSYPGDTSTYDRDRAYVEDVVDYVVGAGIQEIDIEGISTTTAQNEWMAEMIAYPDGTGPIVAPIVPPASYPPRPPSSDFTGFVRNCDNFADYEDAVAQKLYLIFKGLLSLEPDTAVNNIGTEHCVTATLVDGVLDPIVGATINFEVTGVNPTTGSAVTDANGEAQFCYTGTNTGLDTITASYYDDVSLQTIYSNPAEKTWIDDEPPPPVEVGGTVQPVNKLALLTPWITLGILLAAFGAIIIRRRITQS
jgi:hypothetical protein